MAAGVRKRGAVYGIIGLMLCVAVYLNWSYVQSPDELLVAGQTDAEGTDAVATDAEAAQETAGGEAEAVSGEDYFAQSRLSREQARDEAIGILKDTLQDEETDEKTKEEAAAQISRMADEAVAEARVESLIKAKGYAEAVVFLGEDSVNVIIQPPTEGFEAEDAAIVRDIIVTETGMEADQIKIVEAV